MSYRDAIHVDRTQEAGARTITELSRYIFNYPQRTETAPRTPPLTGGK